MRRTGRRRDDPRQGELALHIAPVSKAAIVPAAVSPRQACGPSVLAAGRPLSGALGYHSGVAAEERVAEYYRRSGRPIAARRWRGSSGEIDIVAEDGDGLVFVEVKKSRDFGRAAERVTRRQIERICAAASEFLALMPLGQLTEIRFDVALVNGQGEIDILENAFST